ncbi:MAG TPA: MarR family transcriptional regulator [Deltaproteobacteria bacterium]|nr:MarR family transcriptional regulator [Deltaproteobacteria bacterium]HPR53888.1 MarR family transcriptional regulator [Deltaproteobacteria bacterium]HXK46688.1 MarR family transcriptional regulator [Deltaproteobacteria bacterium]
MKKLSLDESLSFLIYRVHIQGVAVLRRVLHAGGLDVTPEQLGVLARIREQEGVNQNRLAQKVYKDRPNMTRILTLLEKKGYIDRSPDENDNRAYSLYLSETGRAILKKAAPIVLNYWEKRIEGLSREDIAALRRILAHISDNLEGILARII